jgi:hypothetical protein
MDNQAAIRRTGLLVWAMLALPASAGVLEWTTLSEAASGPPYPTTGSVQFSLLDGTLLPAVQRSRIQVGLDSVLCDGSVMPAALLGGSSGGAGGLAGPRGSLDFSIGGPVVSDLNTEMLIQAFGDGSVRQGTVMQDFHFNQGAFDLEFDVVDGDGSVRKLAWYGSIAPGQPFRIGKAGATMMGDGSVRLYLDLLRLPGDQIPGDPVVAMSMTAALVPEPATVLLLGVSGLWLRRRARGG